ncbi:site-specific DNA-methyltransferase [Butyrivibrio proteoclasticus]|uniref:site-specific DNA-methyltransferase n=1 Tax=Butyrivibrio proteoclasticus TaxID=43305 RepID=UPI00047B061D|nr:DNA methyltransferase [Butyrivibrio proteoclasticus]
MAAIHDLLSQIQDEALRERIEKEVDKLAKTKKFGLVFEQHLPECTPLYDMPIKAGVKVMAKNTSEDKAFYVVLKIDGEKAICCRIDNSEECVEKDIKDLVRVAEFGEVIYPYLKPIDSVCNAPDKDVWHTLIEADNYHALQLLEYMYSGKIDCIYIDPPYNTGAKDWKYNNDYVDGNDNYRHSKWLSFMERRLLLAKRLLNPKDSVLIITIDEKEYLHLGCLLEELFPEAKMQMISTITNPKGAPRVNQFMRLDEYIFVLQFGSASPQKLSLSDDFRLNAKDNRVNKLRWSGLAKTQYTREGHPNTFYPIYLSDDMSHIVEIGDPIGVGVDRNSIPSKPGCITVWPINKTSGAEAQWSLSAPKLRDALAKGYVRVSQTGSGGIYYLTSGVIKQVENGEFVVTGHASDGSIIVDESGFEYKFVPGTAWRVTSHDATRYGSDLLKLLMPDRNFPFPKSLYAVEDCIRFFVSDKPNAKILDFFAGSGTTAHAVMLLNHFDNGHRMCISVTNNEVGATDEQAFIERGLTPLDKEWNDYGIAKYCTWPRIKAAITGKNTENKPIENGNYKFLEEFSMSEGLQENAVFFKLGFLDKTSVALGMSLKELVPLLWMKAGAKGKLPDVETCNGKDMLVFHESGFAILANENLFANFAKEIEGFPEIGVVYLVTDYEVNYRMMANNLRGRTTFQLYRDYLDNFRINHGR